MDLGEHYPCLSARDLVRSIEFYEKLDFVIVEEASARVHGNCIFFNTFPDERDQYVRTGKLIDYERGPRKGS